MVAHWNTSTKDRGRPMATSAPDRGHDGHIHHPELRRRLGDRLFLRPVPKLLPVPQAYLLGIV